MGVNTETERERDGRKAAASSSTQDQITADNLITKASNGISDANF